MRPRAIRVALGLGLLAVSLALLIWSLAPVTRVTRTLDLLPAEMALPTPR